MATYKLKVHVVTRDQFNTIQQKAAQSSKFPEILDPQLFEFRLKLSTDGSNSVVNCAKEAQRRYEMFECVTSEAICLYDKDFCYLSPEDKVESMLGPEDVCYLLVDKIQKSHHLAKRGSSYVHSNLGHASAHEFSTSPPVRSPMEPPSKKLATASRSPASDTANSQSHSALPEIPSASTDRVPSQSLVDSEPLSNSNGSGQLRSTPAIPPTGDESRRDAAKQSSTQTSRPNSKGKNGSLNAMDGNDNTQKESSQTSPPLTQEPAGNDHTNAAINETLKKPKRTPRTKNAQGRRGASNDQAANIPGSPQARAIEVSVPNTSENLAELQDQRSEDGSTQTNSNESVPTPDALTDVNRKTVNGSNQLGVNTAPLTPHKNAEPTTGFNLLSTDAHSHNSPQDRSRAKASDSPLPSRAASVPSPVLPVNNAVPEETASEDKDAIDSSDADDDDDDEEYEDTRSRSRQRLSRAREVTASRARNPPAVSRTSAPESRRALRPTRQSTQKDVSDEPPSRAGRYAKRLEEQQASQQTNLEAQGTQESQQATKPPAPAQPSNGKLPSDTHDRVPGLGGFAALTNIRPSVHDGTKSHHGPLDVLEDTQSSEEESDSSNDSSSDDSEGSADDSQSSSSEPSPPIKRRRRGGALATLRR